MPDKSQLSLYLEFIEHHIQLGIFGILLWCKIFTDIIFPPGAEHIFIVTALGWDSVFMSILLRLWGSYINQGLVSIHSSSYDGFDFTDSFGGLQLDRDNTKNFYVNFCTYFTRGIAFLAVKLSILWDFV